MSLFGPPDVENLKQKGNVRGLIKALGYKKDVNIRLKAAQALGEIGDLSAVEPLIAASKNEHKLVRKSTLEALGKIGDLRAMDVLMAALNETDWGIHHAAEEALKVICEALGQSGDPQGVEPLIAILQNGNVKVYGSAKKALIQIGAPAVERLVAQLKSKKWNWEAARILGEIGDQRAVKPLIAAAKTDSNDMRWAAASALGQIGSRSAVAPLIKVLKDKDEVAQKAARWQSGRNAREAAVEALGQIGDPRAVEPLTAALKDKDELVRKAAAKVLETLDESQARDALAAADVGGQRYQMEGSLARYTFSETSLGNPLELEARTEKFCVYCQYLRDPNLRDADYPKGVGECSNYGSGNSVVSFDDSCELWEPNTKVRFWISKGYIEHNREGWPRSPWYQIFDDGPDGEKGTH